MGDLDDLTTNEARLEDFLKNKHPEWLNIDWLLEMLPYHFKIEGKRVLDVGCGFSLIGYSILKKAGAVSYTGIDCSSEVFRPTSVWAKEVFPYRLALQEHFAGRINYLEMSADSMSFPNDSFDLVIAITVTEHIKDLRKVLREIKRVLVPGGYFHLGHHNYFCWDGHHQFSSIDQIEPGNLTEVQTKCLDWGHVDLEYNDPNVYLNRIRWYELRKLVEQEFFVISWKSDYSPVKRGIARLTNQIRNRLSDRYTYEDLAVLACAGLCKKLGTEEVSILKEFGANPLRVDKSAKKSELEKTVESLKRQNKALIDGMTRLKTEKLELEEMVKSLKQQNRTLADEMARLTVRKTEIEEVGKSLKQQNSRLEEQLKLIHQSRSWQIVQKYWHILDAPIMGRILRPIRWILLRLFWQSDRG